jgi:hypothetical protein
MLDDLEMEGLWASKHRRTQSQIAPINVDGHRRAARAVWWDWPSYNSVLGSYREKRNLHYPNRTMEGNSGESRAAQEDGEGQSKQTPQDSQDMDSTEGNYPWVEPSWCWSTEEAHLASSADWTCHKKEQVTSLVDVQGEEPIKNQFPDINVITSNDTQTS